MARFDYASWLKTTLAEAGVKVRGASKTSLKALTVPATRSGNARAPLPPSLRDALAVHEKLAVHGERIVAAPKRSATITALIAARTGSDTIHWNDTPDAAGLVRLPAAGDQALFLWTADAGPEGEYPIVAYDDEPAVFVRYASFAHYLADAFGSTSTKDLERTFGTLARAKRRLERALAREHVAGIIVDVEGPLSPSKRPTSNAADSDDTYSKKYRTKASDVLRDVLDSGDSGPTSSELLSRVEQAKYPTGSTAATALVHLAAETKQPALVADVLIALDRRPEIYNQEWRFDAKVLKAALGREARTVFARAFAAAATAPWGPRFTEFYAREMLPKPDLVELVTKTVLAAEQPDWAIHDTTLNTVARRHVLQAHLRREQDADSRDPYEHLHDLEHALELGTIDDGIRARLVRQGRALVATFETHVGGDAFDVVLASPIFRRAEQAFPEATQPLRDAMNAATPLLDAATKLHKNAKTTTLKQARLDRFRREKLICQQLFLLAWAAQEAQKHGNATLARALAELVLEYDETNHYALSTLEALQ